MRFGESTGLSRLRPAGCWDTKNGVGRAQTGTAAPVCVVVRHGHETLPIL